MRPLVFRILTALPLAGAAALYCAALAGARPFGVPDDTLLTGTTFELLAVHSVPFLGAFVAYRPKRALGHAVRYAGFFGLLALYCYTVYREHGGWAVPAFWAFAGGMYLGLFFTRSARAWTALGSRWLLNLGLFFPAMAIAATGTGADGVFDGPLETQLLFNALYLSGMTSLEVTGLYDRLARPNAKKKKLGAA